MRFAFHNNYLIPEPLLKASSAEKRSFSPAPISKLPHEDTPIINKDFSYSVELQTYLTGRELLLDEIPFPLADIQAHYLAGYLTYIPAIQQNKGHYLCVRCGNDKKKLFYSFHCSRCQEQCSYCRKCIELGRVSQCSPLIRWLGPPLKYEVQKEPLEWQGTLSAAQQKGSEAIVQAISARHDQLIWAVCGSGKTEMLFQGISKAIRAGQQILLAAPRTDVIIELTPRLKQAFPHVSLISLYGGSEDRNKCGQLVLATTHQVLRYYHHFDVVIIDEVDAFPYSFDKSLEYAIRKSKKATSVIIYVTATPTPALKKAAYKGELPYIKIARRFHGYPLPVPRFQWCGNWRKVLKQGKIPSYLKEWLKLKLEEKKQVLLFVPSISVLEGLTSILQKEKLPAVSVHAEDESRHEKIKQFRTREIAWLVTTTILERGVTISNVDVAVLGAEESVFRESALVQIAGRAGRSKDCPTGDVVFFHFGKTSEMKKAKKHIEGMNEINEVEATNGSERRSNH